MSLSQADKASRVQAVLDLLIGQVKRGVRALEQHIGEGDFAVGDGLTRADCSLVPALWMCSSTLPRLGFDSPILEGTRVSGYWAKIQDNEYAARILGEMNKGMKARLDGSERKMAEAAIARARDGQ